MINQSNLPTSITISWLSWKYFLWISVLSDESVAPSPSFFDSGFQTVSRSSSHIFVSHFLCVLLDSFRATRGGAVWADRKGQNTKPKRFGLSTPVRSHSFQDWGTSVRPSYGTGETSTVHTSCLDGPRTKVTSGSEHSRSAPMVHEEAPIGP